MRKRSNDLVSRIESADATFAPNHGKAWRRSFLARFLSLVLIVIAISPLYLGTLPAAADHGPGHTSGVTPELFAGTGNRTCADFERDTQDWIMLKDLPPVSGTHTDGTLVVTITMVDEDSFDWSSNIGVDGVFVKAGSAGSYFYRYDDPDSEVDPGELTSDTGLTVPTPTNNSVSHISFCYDLDPDLTVTKSASKATIQPGESFTYTITASNIGGGTATAVTITDDLDDDLTIVTATFDNDPGSSGGMGACSLGSGNTVTCSVGDLGPNDNNTSGAEGDSAVVTIQVTAPADSCDDLVNQASVTANNEPSNLQGNNTSDRVTVTVVCANVTILKSAPVSTIDAGDIATFTILVTSTGDTTATGVTVSDTLPSGIVWTEDSTQCFISGSLLTCNFGDLAPGETRSVTITGPTGADDCGTKDNTAVVEATNEPPSLQTDNSSSASITIQCGKIEILKTADEASVSAGDDIGFTILVTNTGVGTAKDVKVTDTLPANDGLSWNIDGGTGAGQCSINTGVLTCNFGSMAQNATKTVHISSATTPQTCGVVSNTADAGTSNDGTASSSASVTVNCPDMVISKVGNGTINAGEVASFTIVVTNTGSGIARAVSVTDTLPAGVTWTTNSAGCAVANGNELTCTFGDLAPGATRTVTVNGTTDADDCGDLDNTAFVAATNEAATGNNSDDATVTVLCPDVTVLKLGNGTISAGEDAVFTILVTNTGDGVAKNVTLNDFLPPGISWTETNDPSNACAISFSGVSDVLNCSFGDLAPGETRTVTVSGLTDAQDCGELANTATVDASNEPSNALASNQSSDSVTVLCPDMVISKVGNGTINAGDLASFTIVVTNTGDGEAKDVIVTDTLRSGIVWDDDNDDCDVDNGNELTCNFGDLSPGDTRTVTVSGVVAADDCGDLENTAFVAATNEANTTNNSDDASVIVLCADIDISKSPDQATVNAGDQIGFTIIVANNGAGSAYDVEVSDTLPAGFSWGENPDNLDCNISDNLLTCDFETMTAGATRTVHVVASTDANDCGVVMNTASVGTSNDGSDFSTATVTVNCADVTLQKVGNGTINAGDTAIFTILVTNEGSGDAYNVLVTDTLPSEVTWNISGGTGASDCDIDTGVLTCDFGTMTAGATETVTISATTDADDCGLLDNTAEVAASNEGANDTGDNTDSDSIEVLCSDVVIQKDGNGTINAGDTAVFTILVTNEGPGDAYDVSVTDTLPSGVSWNISGGTGSGACGIDTGVLTCDFGTMTAGATETVQVSGATDAADCGTLNNTAFVASSNESNTENNSDGASIEVLCGDVVIQKDGNGTINAGDTAVFTILVTNTGDGVARDVSVTDTLPSGITWSDDSGDCTVSNGNELSCDFGDLPSGATRTVTLSGATDAADCGTLNNTAFVASSNESNTENNSDEASILVQCADIDISKTADAASVVAGDPIGFTILVTNNGPGRADGVTVTDTLPSNGGLDWDIDGGTGADDCSISLGVLTCTFGSLENAATRTVHISSPTTAASCGTVDNTAFVSTTNDGSDSDGDMVSVTCPTLGINIDKTVAPISGSPGSVVTYTYVVLNTGEATLFNVSVDDDKLGHIGVIAQLDPGQSATLQKTAVLGTTGVINVATATGTDRLGRSVSDSDDASVSVILPLTLERRPAPVIAPQAIATTGVELWPPMLSAFLMILLGAACLRSSRLRPTGEYRWEFERN